MVARTTDRYLLPQLRAGDREPWLSLLALDGESFPIGSFLARRRGTNAEE
jgi:hypothetical protein